MLSCDHGILDLPKSQIYCIKVLLLKIFYLKSFNSILGEEQVLLSSYLVADIQNQIQMLNYFFALTYLRIVRKIYGLIVYSIYHEQIN